jgi:hypothetical protein
MEREVWGLDGSGTSWNRDQWPLVINRRDGDVAFGGMSKWYIGIRVYGRYVHKEYNSRVSKSKMI